MCWFLPPLVLLLFALEYLCAHKSAPTNNVQFLRKGKKVFATRKEIKSIWLLRAFHVSVG